MKILIFRLVNCEAADIDIIRKKWIIDIIEIGFLSLHAISHVNLSITLLRKVNSEIKFILNIIILFLGYFGLLKIFIGLKAEQNSIRNRGEVMKLNILKNEIE